MRKPLIVLCPGLWTGPAIYRPVERILDKHGYQTIIAPLVSTGHRYEPDGGGRVGRPGPTVFDDIEAVRRVIDGAVESGQGTEVIVVMHAGAGVIGSMAIQGLTRAARKKLGKKGGVTKLAYVAAVLYYRGFDWPHMEFHSDGSMTCSDPRVLLFNDFSDEEAELHAAQLEIQPGKGYETGLSVDKPGVYYAWQDDGIQSTYLLCTRDNIFPPRLQERQTMEAGCAYVEECDAGHMVLLSQPERVAKFIRVTAGEVHLME